MAGFDNDVTYSTGTRLEPSSSRDFTIMQATANDIGDMNISGSPEGVVPANPGSTARDRTNGDIYLKKTGNGNTGWEIIVTNSVNSSLTPYIVGDQYSDFIDIQPAIAQAVIDGHDSTNPCNIYVKPNATGYTGDYTGADGVNIVAFGTVNSPRALAFNPVIISGSYTHPDGAKAIVQGIRFVRDGTESVIQEGGELALSDCNFELDNAAVAIQFEEANNKTLVLNNVSINGDGTSFDTDGSSCNITIFQESCDFSNLLSSSFSYTGNLRLEAYSVAYEHAFVIDTSTSTFRVFDSSISTAASFAIDFGSSTTGTFEANNVLSNGAPFLRCQNAGMVTIINYCLGTQIDNSSFSSDQQINGGIWRDGSSSSEVYSQLRTGYRGSEHHHRQAYVQTTNATPTTLFALPVAELESVTLQGMIVGSTADHTQAAGGNFCITARRESGGNITLVGSVITNVNTSSTATFTVESDAPSQNVRIRVVGVAATTINWNTHFEYIKIRDNT